MTIVLEIRVLCSQLYFDLTTASLYNTPTLTGIDPSSTFAAAVKDVFLKMYTTQATSKGAPLIGVNIEGNQTDKATFALTDFQLMVNPFKDANGVTVAEPTSQQRNLYTLKYLCMTANNALPPAYQFPWNWVPPADYQETHGVLSINRNTFRDWMLVHLKDYFENMCLTVRATVDLDSVSQPLYNCDYGLRGGGTTTLPPEGEVVYRLNWTSPASGSQAGLGGAIGSIEAQNYHDATITFKGNTIVVFQDLNLYVKLVKHGSSAEGNIVSRTRTDTYTLAINQSGKLVWTNSSAPNDHDDDLKLSGWADFWVRMNDFIDKVKEAGSKLVESNLVSPPVDKMGDFIFPGGKAFAFRSVEFSDNQDLVTGITYLAPTSTEQVHLAVGKGLEPPNWAGNAKAVSKSAPTNGQTNGQLNGHPAGGKAVETNGQVTKNGTGK